MLFKLHLVVAGLNCPLTQVRADLYIDTIDGHGSLHPAQWDQFRSEVEERCLGYAAPRDNDPILKIHQQLACGQLTRLDAALIERLVCLYREHDPAKSWEFQDWLRARLGRPAFSYFK